MLDLCDQYMKRIRRHVSIDTIEIEARAPRTLLARIQRETRGAHVVALDAGGRTLTSGAFARHLDALMSHHGSLAFLVGGAEGFPSGIDALVSERLSLSPMTLPHRLARVLLLEQIYRATTILHNEPYHR